MASTELLIAFLITSTLFAFIPGPAMLYAAAQTMIGGQRAGLLAALGIHLGCYVHIALAAAGLSVLFHAVPPLYAALKLAGAAYLVWLGISLFRSGNKPTPLDAVQPAKLPHRAFRQSIIVEILNPKTAIFFLAFLPQFVDTTAALPAAMQFALLGIAVNMIFTFADVVCVLLAHIIVATATRTTRVRGLVQKLGGSTLVGLGAHLALQRS